MWVITWDIPTPAPQLALSSTENGNRWKSVKWPVKSPYSETSTLENHCCCCFRALLLLAVSTLAGTSEFPCTWQTQAINCPKLSWKLLPLCIYAVHKLDTFHLQQTHENISKSSHTQNFYLISTLRWVLQNRVGRITFQSIDWVNAATYSTQEKINICYRYCSQCLQQAVAALPLLRNLRIIVWDPAAAWEGQKGSRHRDGMIWEINTPWVINELINNRQSSCPTGSSAPGLHWAEVCLNHSGSEAGSFCFSISI